MKAKCQKCNAEFGLILNKASKANGLECPSCKINLEYPTDDEIKGRLLALDVPTDGKRIIKLILLYSIFWFIPAFAILKYGGNYVQYFWEILLVLSVPLLLIQYKSSSELDEIPIVLRETNGT